MTDTAAETLTIPDTLADETTPPIGHWLCWLCMELPGPAVCGKWVTRHHPKPADWVKCGTCLHLSKSHDCGARLT